MHRVLVIGGGSIGERHVRCFLQTGRAQVAVCDKRGQVRENLASKYTLSDTFEDFESVDLSRFDAAVICVPANLHVPFARRAVGTGVHAFVEKPLSVSLDGVDELARAAQEKEVTVGVAYTLRATHVFQLVKEKLESGCIGEVLSVVYTVGYDHRAARPDYRSTYAASRAMGGGALQDIVSHLSNLIQWLVGPVRQVTACYDHLEIEGIDGEDTASVLMRFRDSRAIANVHCCMWQAGRTTQLIVSGRHGTILAEPVAGRLGVFLRKRNEWEWTEGLAGKRDSKGQTDAPFMVEANAFLDAVEGKGEVLCTLEEAKHTIEICVAAFESGRRGCAVEI